MRLPKGFVASGVRAGIRKKRPDLGMIVAADGATAAAVFTLNKFQAAPVVLSKSALKKSGGHLKAVVVNAGCANAVTGKEGLDAAKRVRTRAAELLQCAEEEVFLASTGVIGVVLPDKKVRDFLPDAITRLSTGGVEALSHAILTTDVGPKVAQASFTIEGKRGRLVGVAKGAGMIHPNMATMLGFVMTDAAVEPATLQKLLRTAVDQSFNAISVDGDTSTNDSFILIATGQAGNAEIADLASADYAALKAALSEVAIGLAQAMARDGEGATKFITVAVEGGRDRAECKQIAYAIARSPLVKTAFFASDPNLGRILAAIGYAGVTDLDVNTLQVYLGDVLVAEQGGRAPSYTEAQGAAVMKEADIVVRVVLNRGHANATVWTCDFSYDYVKINAEYRT